MDIATVYRFVVFTHEDKKIREFVRNTFVDHGIYGQPFDFELRDQYGSVEHNFKTLESTAELALNHALKVQETNPELVSVEVETYAQLRNQPATLDHPA